MEGEFENLSLVKGAIKCFSGDVDAIHHGQAATTSELTPARQKLSPFQPGSNGRDVNDTHLGGRKLVFDLLHVCFM